jgi:hypothetical protein
MLINYELEINLNLLGCIEKPEFEFLGASLVGMIEYLINFYPESP